LDLTRLENVKLQTGIEHVSGTPVLKVAGEVDLYTSPAFKSAIVSLIDAGTKDVIVDLSDVSYMDSGGFGTLLGAVRRVRTEGGSVNLAGCSDNIRRILSITRLDTIFRLFDTVDKAVAGVKAK